MSFLGLNTKALMSSEYKHIDINGVSIAYTDRGEGHPVLFVHGFGSFSFTWRKVMPYLPLQFRFVSIDLKGHGHSEKKCDEHLAPFDQSVILTEFIKRLDLRNMVVVAHSTGGTVSLITLFNDEIRERTERLVLIDSHGVLNQMPDFINDLAAASPRSFMVRLANENLMVSLVLKQAFHDENKIEDETVLSYADILRQNNAKECLIASARQLEIANVRSFQDNVKKIPFPILLIWGEQDAIADLDEARNFCENMPNAELKVVSECGHCPQEEKPFETAKYIAQFLGVESEIQAEEESGEPSLSESPPAESAPFSIIQAPGDYFRQLKMRRLIDRWSLGAFLIIIFIKILQFLKKLGFRAEENGWRKATGIFLRNEHSKFILASFNLKYYGGDAPPEDREIAKNVIIDRLSDFLRKNPACHWTMEWGFFMAKRKKLFFTDIMESEFDHEGRLLRLIPHFDKSRPAFSILNDEIIASGMEKVIGVYNQHKDIDDLKRAWIIFKSLKRWARRFKGLSYAGRQELRHLAERVLNASFIQFETINEDSEMSLKNKFATPNLKNRRHPGFGLLNIVCRLPENLKEADFWFQHHHVPVDGMPMQEMLLKLKEEWGAVKPLRYPALSSPAAKPEIFYFGKRIFRARVYIDFEKLMKLRKLLNKKYYAEMGGPATVSSMVIWGLAQREYFKDRKFLFPVDTALMMDYPQERNISLIFIRPSGFFNEANPLLGFLKYQREFNQRLLATRSGKSESYELLELYSMIHPLFYYFARYYMPKATGEFLGTAGLTILRDAEMFVSPLTDLQFNGFVALGNLMMPTEDGKTAGAVSICGSRLQVGEYIKAFYELAEKYPSYLGMNL